MIAIANDSPNTEPMPSTSSVIVRHAQLGICLELSACGDLSKIPVDTAISGMQRLEAGDFVNFTENRQVGHYWLRAPELAPTQEVRQAITSSWQAIEEIECDPDGQIVLLGIGGSALGAQLMHSALQTPGRTPDFVCLDNCDPQGISDALGRIDPRRARVVVASKSGRTNETLLALTAMRAHFDDAGVDFKAAAIAVTEDGSHLSHLSKHWSTQYPVWSWVGGRTSLLSPVGLVPLALLGFDWRAALEGAALCDEWTRSSKPSENPALLLAQAWMYRKQERGLHTIVFQPYRDRLTLLSKYFQQLIMESIGKRLNRSGQDVLEGLTVLGNKGSTDQHSLMQQLIEGQDDTMVHFLETFEHDTSLVAHESGLTCDHLLCALRGCRDALSQNGRANITLSLPRVDARSLGATVALFERAVGYYAFMADINAYDQPAVEHGKVAARGHLVTLAQLTKLLGDEPMNVGTAASAVGQPVEVVWRLLTHLAHTDRASLHPGEHPWLDRFSR